MKFNLLIIGLTIATLSGCTYYSTPFIHHSDIKDVNFSKLHEMKTAEACRTRFIFFDVEGDSSVSFAASRANISKVKYVEEKIYNGLFIHKRCVQVYGE